ncbi:MAG: hypothetical protein M3R24_41560 [Chloroflexota bacterium]|nr:hypothetical protein [Chloroflexota bacterium]
MADKITIALELTNPIDRDNFLRDLSELLQRYPRIEGKITKKQTLQFIGGGEPLDLRVLGVESDPPLVRMMGGR